jgi:4a-hydroxytetrahydrobiopterin dehydratase
VGRIDILSEGRDSLGDMDEELTRQEISDAVTGLGWRYVLGTVRTSVPVASLAQAAEVAGAAVAACGDAADECLWFDARPDRVVLTLQTLARAYVTPRDIKLAERVSTRLSGLGLATVADIGHGAPRSVQILEIAIDALDIASIRPFWRAVLGYVDEADRTGPTDPLVDPVGQGPAIWFQQMDVPRPQRNRVHFDISVPHDEATHRLEAALAAGGRLVSDAHAPAFWVLADAEGNEVCITTWQGRD